jgi:cytosine/adenosine deaminase-related metal-dependent hydrolase
MDPDRRILEGGAIAVDGPEIVAIGGTRQLDQQFEPDRIFDAKGALVHPGFIDCHIHVSLHITRGLFSDTATWEEAVKFYTSFWNTVDDEDEYAASLLACLEMACNGTTCFLEAGTVLTPDTAATAAEEVGIRALISDPLLWDVGGFASDAPIVKRAPPDTERALSALGGQLSRNRDPNGLVRGHVAVVGMGSASDELEMAAKACADTHDVVLNQHQSYAPLDANDDDTRFGMHPLLHFADLGVLGDNCTFAHMNVLREDELSPVVDSGMSIAWCPVASMMFGVGGTLSGHHLDLHRAGVNIALGSDSANWSGKFDLSSVGLISLLSAREREQSRTALNAMDVMAMATINGARAVGLADSLGSLEVGKRADIVMRTHDLPEAIAGDPVQAAVFSTGSKNIDSVWIDGRLVIEGGRSVRVDHHRVFALAHNSLNSLAARLA